METQGSLDWHMRRLGKVTGSRVFSVVDTDAKGKPRASYDNLMHELAMELWTGQPTEAPKTFLMREGTRKEPIARIRASFELDEEITEVGFEDHATVPRSGVSLDGIIDARRASVEIKCPMIRTHMEYLASDSIPPNYMCQIQWGMAVYPKLTHCYFVSYCPDVPRHIQLLIRKIDRNPAMIARMEAMVTDFVAKMESKLDEFKQRYPAA